MEPTRVRLISRPAQGGWVRYVLTTCRPAGLLRNNLIATATIQAAYVRNISRGGQPSEGVTVATKTAQITNPMEGKSPVTISGIRLPGDPTVRDKLMLIIKAATGNKRNAEVPAMTWTPPTT